MFNQVKLGRRLGLDQVSLRQTGYMAETTNLRLDRMPPESWMLKLAAAILQTEEERWTFNHR
jgi:hypothetical protein